MSGEGDRGARRQVKWQRVPASSGPRAAGPGLPSSHHINCRMLHTATPHQHRVPAQLADGRLGLRILQEPHLRRWLGTTHKTGGSERGSVGQQRCSNGQSLGSQTSAAAALLPVRPPTIPAPDQHAFAKRQDLQKGACEVHWQDGTSRRRLLAVLKAQCQPARARPLLRPTTSAPWRSDGSRKTPAASHLPSAAPACSSAAARCCRQWQRTCSAQHQCPGQPWKDDVA